MLTRWLSGCQSVSWTVQHLGPEERGNIFTNIGLPQTDVNPFCGSETMNTGPGNGPLIFFPSITMRLYGSWFWVKYLIVISSHKAAKQDTAFWVCVDHRSWIISSHFCGDQNQVFFSWGGGPSPAVFLGWPKPANPNQTGFVSKPKQSTSTLFWQEIYIYGFAEIYRANIYSGHWFGTVSFIRRWKTKSLVKCVNVVNLARLKVARFVSACGKSNLFICTGKKPIAC